jgi:hypothetical protein
MYWKIVSAGHREQIFVIIPWKGLGVVVVELAK